MTAQDVLHFWFEETTPDLWFRKDDAFDAAIRARFGALHARAALGELWEWRADASGRLSEVIVLDQFSRNLLRGRAESFAQDGMALALAQEAVARGLDADLPPPRRAFLYMPFMHSESARIQAESVRLFTVLGQPNNLDFALQHQAIVDRFGRFPHRNTVLGRETTAEEALFLQQPGSSF
ncbi:DUF924 family protein [Paracidovorax cattleyae]|uniref:Uncharacterized conserved protein, DUF924 family n=1 Tax=Paracidovorax cattleyae TaxID=80868 RepID=A0A1H0PDY7_9BURK|nr:DUF924 family protein [Paracidovorax cattleyae]AVS76015.1 DUF924 domain-containing protein [Paracidovorax cattleyae]SDP03302.1 Uncharacterized conserved protein, DUF924 family [Paracidovorax cattleyae]